MGRLARLLTIAGLVIVALPASGTATNTRAFELQIDPIKARFSERLRQTTYSVPNVRESATGATVFYNWTLTLEKVDAAKPVDGKCNNHGKLSGIDKRFVWHHGNTGDPFHDDNCDHTKQGIYGHQGLITVVVSDDHLWHCTETYKGTFPSTADSVKNGIASEPDCNTKLLPVTPKPEQTLQEQLLTQLSNLDHELDSTIASLKRPGAYGMHNRKLDATWNEVGKTLGTFPGTKLGIVDTVNALHHVDFNLLHLGSGAEFVQSELESAANGLDKVGTGLAASPKLAELGAEFQQLGVKAINLKAQAKAGANSQQIHTDAAEIAKEKDKLIGKLPKVFGVGPTELFADVYAIDYSLYRADQYEVDGDHDPTPYIGSYERARAAKQKLEAAVKAAK